MDELTYIELEPQKHSRLQMPKQPFGWFWLTRQLYAFTIEGIHWLPTSIIYGVGFLTVLLPAVLIETALTGVAFLIVKFILFLVELAKRIIFKIADKTVDTSFSIIKVASIIVIIVVVIISLFTNTDTWIHAADKGLQSLLQFLSSLF